MMLAQAWQDGTPGWWTTEDDSDVRVSPHVVFWCDVKSPPLASGPDMSRLRCARPVGHTGRHAAYGLHAVLAVWP